MRTAAWRGIVHLSLRARRPRAMCSPEGPPWNVIEAGGEPPIHKGHHWADVATETGKNTTIRTVSAIAAVDLLPAAADPGRRSAGGHVAGADPAPDQMAGARQLGDELPPQRTTAIGCSAANWPAGSKSKSRMLQPARADIQVEVRGPS